MNTIKYLTIQLFGRFTFVNGNKLLINCLRKEGCKIGYDTHLFSNVSPEEPYLVEIGNNCTISTEVSFITHDASVGLFFERKNLSDVCGKITIGNNCFIGNRVVLMYGVNIPDNTIVAAGSVVTKSIKEQGCIVGGNPAKVIGKVSNFMEKSKKYALNLHGSNSKDRRCIIEESNKLITR